MSILSARKLNFSFANKQVIDDVSFDLESSQILALLGPNGSGKTTLLRIINGTLPLSSGSLLLDGRDIRGWSRRDIARTVATVPQEAAAAFPFYAEEIVLMGRFPHLKPWQFEGRKDYRIIREAMEKTDSLSLARRPFQELSAGERQRVLIARALAQSPKILLLDESTVFLDIKHQAQFLTLVRQLSKTQNLTVIFVTHDLNLAAQNADRIIFLAKGKIYAIGMPAETITATNIKEVYDVDVVVDANCHNGLPQVTLIT